MNVSLAADLVIAGAGGTFGNGCGPRRRNPLAGGNAARSDSVIEDDRNAVTPLRSAN